jgi:serine/threonine protein kinase
VLIQVPNQAILSTSAPQALVRYEQQLTTASLGSVWLGRLLNGNDAGRRVILRRISRQWLSSKDAEWVLYGATAYSKVRHPSLVKLLGILEQDDDLVSISEHLEGVRLVDLQRTVFAEGVPIPATVAVRLILDAARATWKAHHLAADVGIFPTERLFLPEGVLVTGYGETLLTEVGVLSALSRCVMPRTVPDVLAQLAPEELGAKTPAAGSPEVFSLGVVFWELLANRWLFSRESDSRTHQELLLSTIPALDQIERFGMPVPDVIVNLVRQATQRDPTRRFSSVNDLVLALERLPAHFIATEQQVAEVLRQRAAALLKASKGENSLCEQSGTFAEVRSSQPSIAPPSASSHDWDRPTFAQSSLVGRPAFVGSVTPVSATNAPAAAVAPTDVPSEILRPRRRFGVLSMCLTMAAVGVFVLTFRGVPPRLQSTSSPAPAARVAPRPASASPKILKVAVATASPMPSAALIPSAAPTPAEAPPEASAVVVPTKRTSVGKRVAVHKLRPAPTPPPPPPPPHESSPAATNIDRQWGI